MNIIAQCYTHNKKGNLVDVGLLGIGYWGTAIATLLSSNVSNVIAYSNNEQVVHNINYNKQSFVFPNIIMPLNVVATNTIDDISKCKFIFLALPVQVTNEILKNLRQCNLQEVCFVICSKGIDCKTLLLISEMIENIFPDSSTAVLSGPNFANEIIQQNYSASTIACKNFALAQKIQNLLKSNKFITSITDDLISVQIAGSLKNVMAILCGILKAKNYGNNAHAAILTMGMREIIKFAVAKGGKIETLIDYCGIGDLVLTCYSENSRNMKLGIDYVNGNVNTNNLAEGFYTLEAAIKLAQKLQIKDIPIFETIHNILYNNHDIDLAFKKLFCFS